VKSISYYKFADRFLAYTNRGKYILEYPSNISFRYTSSTLLEYEPFMDLIHPQKQACFRHVMSTAHQVTLLTQDIEDSSFAYKYSNDKIS